MIQTCYFNETPNTINNGGFIKGHWIVWLNLCVIPNVSSIKKDGEDNWMFASQTDRLVLTGHSTHWFLEAVDPAHLAMATTMEVEAILKHFGELEDIESWRAIRKVQVQGFNKSEKVNRFCVGAESYWLDKATRVGLVNSITTEKNAGRTDTVLWLDGRKITLPVDKALDMLSQLELYALDCYSVTAQHLADIDGSDSIEKLRNIDITADYPAALQFNLND